MLQHKRECDNMASPWGLECTELCYHASHIFTVYWCFSFTLKNVDWWQPENAVLVKFLQNSQPCELCSSVIKWSKNSSRNTTKGILAKDGVGVSEIHVSAFYSGHHQVTVTDYTRYIRLKVCSSGWCCSIFLLTFLEQRVGPILKVQDVRLSVVFSADACGQ
jgi:hypothetical protein